MASLLHNVPLEYLHASQKYAFMNYLVKSALPSRITRQMLEQWGAAVGVTLTSTDYDLLNSHSLVTPHRP